MKSDLQAARYPPSKCFWHAAQDSQLVAVTASVALSADPNVDIELVDAIPGSHVYQSKRGLSGEAEFAITTHGESDVGVRFENHLDYMYRTRMQWPRAESQVYLDVDIGADAVDYTAIVNEESLSVLETEIRKVEGVVNGTGDHRRDRVPEAEGVAVPLD